METRMLELTVRLMPNSEYVSEVKNSAHPLSFHPKQ